jgi:heptaprenyl diphosphate synthase
LIATSARFGALLSGATPEIVESLTRFGEKIGVVFQLADDIIDIASESNESGKTPGTDLREGVPTLVTLLVLESKDPADQALRDILSAPITDEQIVTNTLAQLRNHAAMGASRKILQQYADEARLELNNLPDGAAKRALIELCETIITRTS